jgi:antirestriction protein
LKQVLTKITDLTNIDSSELEELNELLTSISSTADDFEKERKAVLRASKKSSSEGKMKDMEYRLDEEAVAVYDMVEEVTTMRESAKEAGQIGIFLAKGEEQSHL